MEHNNIDKRATRLSIERVHVVLKFYYIVQPFGYLVLSACKEVFKPDGSAFLNVCSNSRTR